MKELEEIIPYLREHLDNEYVYSLVYILGDEYLKLVSKTHISLIENRSTFYVIESTLLTNNDVLLTNNYTDLPKLLKELKNKI